MSTAKKKTEEPEDEVPSTASNPRFTTVHRGKSRYAGKRLELPLAGVRAAVAKTQVDVAAASGINQGEVSRLERRTLDDMQIGTLRRYLAGMGVELELVAITGTSRIAIKSPE